MNQLLASSQLQSKYCSLLAKLAAILHIHLENNAKADQALTTIQFFNYQVYIEYVVAILLC